LLYFSLIISLIIGENSTGGAVKDYLNQKSISQDFSINFYETLFNFDKYNTRHSPVLIIFLSFFEKLNFNDFFIRFIHLNLNLILPIYFFKSINLIFKNKNIAFFLVSLIFISPTFRSLSIWPDSRLLGLAFFSISVYEYLKFSKNKKFINCIKNIIFLSLSAYLSPNFSLFALFYFFKFITYYKDRPKIIFYIIILNVFISLPAFVYLFYLETNFLTTAAVKNENSSSIFLLGNIFNNTLLIFSIIFFYLIPFFYLKIFNFNFNQNIVKNFILSISLFIICIFFFDYKHEYTGGGIFFKFFYIFLDNKYLFFIIASISIFSVFVIINFKFYNLLLIIILILSNPQITVYHKYYDPLLLILFFTLYNIKINMKILEINNSKIFIFLYFLIFLIINNFKSYVL
tara:strand:- start:324 stop:1529 length:1206 start_codon:yes stop_codon:yes gene_type:complete